MQVSRFRDHIAATRARQRACTATLWNAKLRIFPAAIVAVASFSVAASIVTILVFCVAGLRWISCRAD